MLMAPLTDILSELHSVQMLLNKLDWALVEPLDRLLVVVSESQSHHSQMSASLLVQM